MWVSLQNIFLICEKLTLKSCFKMNSTLSSLEASEYKISITIWIDVSSSDVFGQCSSISPNKTKQPRS